MSPLKDLETDFEQDDEFEYPCVHGFYDDEPCVICDNDPELQGVGADIIEDDDDGEDSDDDADSDPGADEPGAA